ncbi:Phosphatidylserine decarboxylase [Shewanella sediminis HAW-EB3]|uniref:Phosphatidylserine decarboxylase proenzyme n=1 Tax=Shewanella sediminis (strain HAW-EB3) TaxID=425104 RepID=PSD_SHESH|nr:archaetidylserine decarboxylase [Shewanella sediminis]A8FRC6.1 RecName: Full=Phosphatidylserine decarboxylase proenzyme; Contains: RecName: Full=Phosphatidylserine decarboxylase alpha chain; Contains: RecName: Full=Phosphatidylserine decarboxylase beta chain [Shewanella sediminis HAW-EB3]ABV35399.1 Phosphatidylserine decarboxylase [Shewanella sediminis HAW-EB3]
MDKIKIALQYMMPKHLISRLVGKLAAAELGSITTAAIKWFIKQYKIDMSEAAQSEPEAYTTFNNFFTRALKPGIRPLFDDKDYIVHPVDGAISQCGPIKGDQIFQAKGHEYSSLALLGNQADDAKRFEDGDFATIYLAPKDYHRIHMPIKGTLSKMTYVPGDLFSVNPLTAENVPGLFARNERVVALFETEIGPMAMVLVGATIVASIETVWAGTVTPPAGKKVFTWDYPTEGPDVITLDKGDEMGRFKLGSTVVMLFAKDALDEFAKDVVPKAVTRMGQPFAKIED